MATIITDFMHCDDCLEHEHNQDRTVSVVLNGGGGAGLIKGQNYYHCVNAIGGKFIGDWHAWWSFKETSRAACCDCICLHDVLNWCTFAAPLQGSRLRMPPKQLVVN